MGKKLFIAEKPSVAAEFAKALGMAARRQDGYMESQEYVVTWCVGHLVKLSYPEVYDPALKRWSMQTLPFIPHTFRYEIISDVKKQFGIVSGLLKRKDVDTIYVCTDSGREGEYIYRLVDMMAGIGDKEKRRVWIDSQTEDEIRRGIREALPESAYDNLAASAFLRAKEDYLMGINFSRVLTLKYGAILAQATGQRYAVVSTGRVMTCVLGMVVRREREIREFVKTPFFRVLADCTEFSAEWRAMEGSRYFASPLLYKDSGFLKREDAEALIKALPDEGVVEEITKKKETKAPPLLFNLAELQNECARLYKISPDSTLSIAQELYEKKLTTYPRTDARVLSSAVAKEIRKNISGLCSLPSAASSENRMSSEASQKGSVSEAQDMKRPASVAALAGEVLNKKAYEKLLKTKYVNDKAITDHYAIIPTGQGFSALKSLRPLSARVYELICRRFLSIFFPPAEYRKIALTVRADCKDGKTERFSANFRTLINEGYLRAAGSSGGKQGGRAAGVGTEAEKSALQQDAAEKGADAPAENAVFSAPSPALLERLKRGDAIRFLGFSIKEGETAPPKRYTSGSMILAMENAGQFIEDEELRAQIRSSGIGTSATRAEILKKLVTIKYLSLNQKTQVITPTMLGEMVSDVVYASIRPLLNPELTASWEKGLTYVAEGSVSEDDYMQKLDDFVRRRTEAVKAVRNEAQMRQFLMRIPKWYEKPANKKSSTF